MTLKNKIIGTIATAYLGGALTCGILSNHLGNNFDYSQERDNGQVVKVENRKGKKGIFPKKITITYGESFVSGRDSDNNGSLDEIVLNLKSKDAQASLLPFKTQESLTRTYDEIIESKEYKKTIQKRQKSSAYLFGYTMLSLLVALPISSIYKYTTATPEQLSDPFFHCR